MTRSRAPGHAVSWTGLGSTLASAALALAFAVFGAGAHAAVAKDTTLSKEDKVCLDCHAKPDQYKTLKNGEKLSLVISPKGFAESVHNSSGCEGCHSDVDLADHGKQPKSIASKREHSTGLMETCRDCHKKTMKQYDDSVHSALVRAGSDKAPLCTDCGALFEYAKRRLERCVFGDAKPACANCLVHCYKADRREQIRVVMRWAGPRMLLRHPVMAIAHMIADRRPVPTLPAKRSK